MADVDTARLAELIETSFGGKLVPDYWDSIKDSIHRIYISEQYKAVAIIRKVLPSAFRNECLVAIVQDPTGGDVAYLDKFAVVKQNQSEGTGQRSA